MNFKELLDMFEYVFGRIPEEGYKHNCNCEMCEMLRKKSKAPESKAKTKTPKLISYKEFLDRLINETEGFEDEYEFTEFVFKRWAERGINFYHPGETGEKYYVGQKAGATKILSDIANIIGNRLIIEKFSVDGRITSPLYALALERLRFYEDFYTTEVREL